jgi:hypothetical protein
MVQALNRVAIGRIGRNLQIVRLDAAGKENSQQA